MEGHGILSWKGYVTNMLFTNCLKVCASLNKVDLSLFENQRKKFKNLDCFNELSERALTYLNSPIIHQLLGSSVDNKIPEIRRTL